MMLRLQSIICRLGLCVFWTMFAGCNSPTAARALSAEWRLATLMLRYRSGFTSPENRYEHRIIFSGGAERRSVDLQLQRGAQRCQLSRKLTPDQGDQVQRAIDGLRFCLPDDQLPINAHDAAVAELELRRGGDALRFSLDAWRRTENRICAGREKLELAVAAAMGPDLPHDCPRGELFPGGSR